MLPTPKVGLKVLVWDGYFGADFPELRMPLPNHYPLKSMPYDQNEDTSARAMEEALVSCDHDVYIHVMNLALE